MTFWRYRAQSDPITTNHFAAIVAFMGKTMSSGMTWSDAAVLRLLKWNGRLRGYRTVLAQSPLDLDEHAHVLRSTFLQQGYFQEYGTPFQPEPPGSITHIWLARHHAHAVGTIRLVQSDLRWPFEIWCPCRVPNEIVRQEAAEIGRFNILPAHRRRRFVVTYALLSAAFEYSRRAHIRWWVGCAPAPLILSCLPYTTAVRILDLLPLEDHHRKARAGREAYFAEHQSVRPFLIDLSAISLVEIARIVVQQRIRQRNFWQYKRSAA